MDRESIKLPKLELYQENGYYFLRAEFEIKSDYRMCKYVVPKIELPIVEHPIIYQDLDCSYLFPYNRAQINFGFGKLNILQDENTNYYTMEVVEEYPQKMTLEEVEKKLGYKVELVSGK